MQGAYVAKRYMDAWVITDPDSIQCPIVTTADTLEGAFDVGQVYIFDGTEEELAYEISPGSYESKLYYRTTDGRWTDSPNAFINIPYNSELFIKEGIYVVAPYGNFYADHDITGMQDGLPVFQAHHINGPIPSGTIVEVENGEYYGYHAGYDDTDLEDCPISGPMRWCDTDYGFSCQFDNLQYCYPVGLYTCISKVDIWTLPNGIPTYVGNLYNVGRQYEIGGIPEYINGEWYYPTGNGQYIKDMSSFEFLTAPMWPPSGQYVCNVTSDIWVIADSTIPRVAYNTHNSFTAGTAYSGGGYPQYVDGVWYYPMFWGYTTDMSHFTALTSTPAACPEGYYVCNATNTMWCLPNDTPTNTQNSYISGTVYAGGGTPKYVNGQWYYPMSGAYTTSMASFTAVTQPSSCPSGNYVCNTTNTIWVLPNGVPTDTHNSFIAGSTYAGGGSPRYVNGQWYYPMGGAYTTSMSNFSAISTPSDCPVGTYKCTTTTTGASIVNGTVYYQPNAFVSGSTYTGGGSPQYLNGTWYYPMNGGYTMAMSCFTYMGATSIPDNCPSGYYACITTSPIWVLPNGVPTNTQNSFTAGSVYIGGGTPEYINGQWYYPMSGGYTKSMSNFNAISPPASSPSGYYSCNTTNTIWELPSGVPTDTHNSFIAGSTYSGGGTPQYANGQWYYPMSGGYTTSIGSFNVISAPASCPSGSYRCNSANTIWVLPNGIPTNTHNSFLPGTTYSGGGSPQYVNGTWYYPMGGGYTTSLGSFTKI